MTTISIRVGSRVERVDNPRHVGRVIAIFSSHAIRVLLDNGWRENVEADDITRCTMGDT